MTKSAKRNTIVSAILAIMLCISLMAGATFALFTSESKVNIAVTSGKVSVVATVDNLQTYSGVELTGDPDTDTLKETEVNGTFTNGGTAAFNSEDANTLELTNMTPGDKVTFNIKVTNKSNVAVKYRTKITVSDGGLYDALTITIDDVTFDRKVITEYKVLAANESPADVKVKVAMPSSIGNDYQDLSCALHFVVEAIQGNAVGEADTYPVYPTGVTTSSFESAESVYYYYDPGTGDPFEVRTATTENDLNNYPAAVAYVDSNGSTQYAADISTAIAQGATTIYCKENAEVKMLVTNTTSPQVHTISKNQTLTIYGNGAKLNRFDIKGDVGTVNLKIYDTKSVYILGEKTAEGNIVNVSLENCHNVGESATGQAGRMFYSSDTMATTNLSLNNCSITKAETPVYMNSNGSVTVTNCIFRKCASALKISHKASGACDVTVKDTTFIQCGCTTEMAPNGPEYLTKDSSSIKCKTKGTMTLTLENVAIKNVVGDHSIVVGGDASYTGTTTVNATNVTVDGVEWTYTAQTSD